MNNPTDTLFSAWQTAATCASELARSSPGNVLLPVIAGAGAWLVLELLRSKVCVPFLFNGDYRQTTASFCIGLFGGGVTAAVIVGLFAVSSPERAAESWKERSRSLLFSDDQWHLEVFRRLFDEIRNTAREDLKDIPDPVAHGGTKLPLTKPESWKLAESVCHDAAWSRLTLGSAPLAAEWPEKPAPSHVPPTPGIVSRHPMENPALFAAIESTTQAGATHAAQHVREHEGGFRAALLVSMLLAQLASWLTIILSATRDISAE